MGVQPSPACRLLYSAAILPLGIVPASGQGIRTQTFESGVQTRTLAISNDALRAQYGGAMYGYLGPEGTFTHQALLTLTDAEVQAFSTVAATLAAVRSGEIEAGLVPIENSIEGGVSATLDALAGKGNGRPLQIVAEVLLPVRFGLWGRPGTTLESIQSVLTHPHASAQCRGWLARRLPEAEVSEGGSTAAAAQEVASPESRYDAAVCAQVAGEIYGLELLADDISDIENAVTRFVLVAANPHPTRPCGHDKTTLVAYLHEDRPGALLELLEQFASRGVNLCRIESRPTKQGLGSYCFSIDAEGHLADARMAEALMGLHRICKDVVFLGSYQRADGRSPLVPHSFEDSSFASAFDWLQGLRGESRD